MFAALRHRNFRLYWIGSLVANTGDWMDQIAIGWLIWELTGSGVYLGILAFCRAFPILLFTLFGGAVADRFERRRVMQVTQSFAMLLALALALLVYTDVVEVWQVLAIAALRGVMLSVNLPTRQALLSDIVDRQHLPNAIALNSATLNLTRILGGSLGGLLITLVGSAGVFLFNGLSFIILIVALALMTIPPCRAPGKPSQHPALDRGGTELPARQPDPAHADRSWRWSRWSSACPTCRCCRSSPTMCWTSATRATACSSPAPALARWPAR